MKKILNPTLFILFIILFVNLSSCQVTNNPDPITNNQDPISRNHLRIAFYNVENLFDTIDDPNINDADFLPGARIPWTSERYEVKLSNIADVIKALSNSKPVAIMGLCEVENKAVIDDLLKSPALLPFRYQVIHRESPDERGIDNAMIYDAAQFTPVAVYSIPVRLDETNTDRTRDILYVKGVSPKAKTDTLHIFVNHWPSRSGGQEISEPKRIKAAETLLTLTDSLFSRNTKSLIIALGDFNDEPSNQSLSGILKAAPPTERSVQNGLYNLMYPLYKQGKGTLWYKDWDLFDQVIVSGNLIAKERGICVTGTEGNIFDADWLMFKSDDGASRPNRTSAKEYYGGYSDHLPVYIDLIIKK